MPLRRRHTRAAPLRTAPRPPAVHLPPAPAAWQPSASERAFFDTLFELADAEKAGAVAGASAVRFFSTSGLPREQLKLVWTAANLRNGTALSRHEFWIAMRLVALAQSGMGAPTREAFLATLNAPLPLPRFDGVAPPTAALLASAAAPAPVAAVAAPAAALGWPMLPEELQRYEDVWTRTDTDRDGFVDGQPALELLSKSGLDQGSLRAVWELADIDR